MDINTQVWYEARLSNGVILEDTNFRNVYRAALREIRSEYGHSLYFNRGQADISLCVVTDVHAGSRYVSSRAEVRKICKMRVYSICRITHVIVEKVVD